MRAITPANGTTADATYQEPTTGEQIAELRGDVVDLRAEVRAGFASINTTLESLRQKDASHDVQLGTLAKRYASVAGVLLAGGAVGNMVWKLVSPLILGH